MKIAGWIGKGIIAPAVALAMAGCAAKEEGALFAKLRERSRELQTLQQTEKTIFRAGREDEIIVLATYTGGEKSEGPEPFVLAVSPAAQGSALSAAARLDGKAPLQIRRVERDAIDPSLEQRIPGWFGIYRVVFPPAETKAMRLELTDGRGERRALRFVKGPKYLVTKPKF